mgnify:CR=1 FL=1
MFDDIPESEPTDADLIAARIKGLMSWVIEDWGEDVFCHMMAEIILRAGYEGACNWYCLERILYEIRLEWGK